MGRMRTPLSPGPPGLKTRTPLGLATGCSITDRRIDPRTAPRSRGGPAGIRTGTPTSSGRAPSRWGWRAPQEPRWRFRRATPRQPARRRRLRWRRAPRARRAVSGGPGGPEDRGHATTAATLVRFRPGGHRVFGRRPAIGGRMHARLPIGFPCSFCGLRRAGGVAGPTPAVYICPDCIRLSAQLLEGPSLVRRAEEPEARTSRSRGPSAPWRHRGRSRGWPARPDAARPAAGITVHPACVDPG